MTSIVRGTLHLFVCLTLTVLGGCASVSKVTDWFAKSDDSASSQMTAKGDAAPAVPQAPAVYQSQSFPAPQGQPATAGSAASLQPTSPSQPGFPPGLPQEGSAPQTITTAAATGLVRGGNPAPTFTAKTMDGAGFDLAQQQGKVVLLDFWRKTCGPCLRAIPKVETLRGQYGPHQLTILGINCDEKLSVARAFVKSNPHPWPQVHAYSQSPNPIRAYGVSALPVFVVIDQVGAIQYKGNNITTASAKVVELIGAPSIPQTGAAGFYTAQR